MFTKIMVISAAIVAVTVGAHAMGLINLKSVPKDLGLSDELEQRHTIVAIDITAGREGEIKKDVDAVEKLIEKAGLGDKIEVYLIHARAESQQESIFSLEMPLDPGPMGMALRRAKKTAGESFAKRWDASVNALLKDGRLVQQTDLLGFFRFVSQKQEFRKAKKPILIVFTDGQQVGDGFNFERATPTAHDLKKIRDENLMSNLDGVSVTMAGVTPTHNITNSHWRKLQSWWTEYLRNAGAEITSISSERYIESLALP